MSIGLGPVKLKDNKKLHFVFFGYIYRRGKWGAGGAQAPPELFLAPPTFEPPLTIKKIFD